jgi:hypothetical protein
MYKTLISMCLAATSAALSAEAEVATEGKPKKFPAMGNEYRDSTAEEKWELLKPRIFDGSDVSEVSYDVRGFLDHKMNKTTCNRNDQMGRNRTKTAHQIGVVAEASWVSAGEHPYTGLFESGAELGVIRLSDSGFLFDDIDESNPSFAVKFLIDGQESANLMFAIDWNQTPGKDFFPKDDEGIPKAFTNHPRPFEDRDSCERVVQAAKLSQGSAFPFSTGTSAMAMFNLDGSEVEKAEFPYELRAYVNTEVIPEFDSQSQMDYIGSIAASGDEPLFTIYAKQDPESEEELIGYIHTSSDMTTSTFGDDQLFFRHQAFNRDMRLMKQQGDKPRMKQWRDFNKSTFLPLTEWNNEWNEDLPTDELDMSFEEIVHASLKGEMEGAEHLSCPFAWILRGTGIEDGMILWGEDPVDEDYGEEGDEEDEE